MCTNVSSCCKPQSCRHPFGISGLQQLLFVCSFSECLGHLGQLQPTMGAQQAFPYLAGAGAVNALPDIDPNTTNYFTDFYCPLVPKFASEPPSHAQWVREVNANHALLREVHSADAQLLPNQKRNTGGEIATRKPLRPDDAADADVEATQAKPPVVPPQLGFGVQDCGGVAPALYSRPVFTRPFTAPPSAPTSGFFTSSAPPHSPQSRPGTGSSATVAMYNPYSSTQHCGSHKPGHAHGQHGSSLPPGAGATTTFYPSPYSAMPSSPPRLHVPAHGASPSATPPAHHSPPQSPPPAHASLPHQPPGPADRPVYPGMQGSAHPGQHVGFAPPAGGYGQQAQPPRYPQMGSPTAHPAYPGASGPPPAGIGAHGTASSHGPSRYPEPGQLHGAAYPAPPAPHLHPPPRQPM